MFGFCGTTLGHFGEVLLIDNCLCVAQNIPWLFGKVFSELYSPHSLDDVDDYSGLCVTQNIRIMTMTWYVREPPKASFIPPGPLESSM